MNKGELVGRIAAETQLTRTQAGRALDSFLRAVQSSLVKGERVTLSGFGTFAVARRKARLVRDPRRGIPMTIRARSVARFAPGLELKLAIDSAETIHGSNHTGNPRPS